VLLALGLIPALISCIFELTPDGLRREQNVDRSQSIVERTARKFDLVPTTLDSRVSEISYNAPG